MNQRSCIVALAVTLGIGTVASGQITKEQQDAFTPEQIVQEMLEGNERFVRGDVSNPAILERIATSSEGQHPKAVILSCLDSRVPVEIVFDLGIGDLFVGRVAGNIENEDQLGSMEFATKIVGAKVVMVLGHTECGAVKGASDGAELGNLTALLEKIKPAVDAVKGHEDQGRNSNNINFINEVVEANVRKTVKDIRSRSAILAELEKSGQIKIVGAVYDIHTGKVTLL